jgi:hypothetical protein
VPQGDIRSRENQNLTVILGNESRDKSPTLVCQVGGNRLEISNRSHIGNSSKFVGHISVCTHEPKSQPTSPRMTLPHSGHSRGSLAKPKLGPGCGFGPVGSHLSQPGQGGSQEARCSDPLPVR